MEKITSLQHSLADAALAVSHLRNLTFIEGEVFRWDHTACVIYYNPNTPDAAAYMLHEFGHALLNHHTYPYSISLLEMERDAWEEARRLAPTYHTGITDDVVQDALDTYRDWLHSRSLCPVCSATGIETSLRRYKCLSCYHTWQTNEAHTCALRRYPTKGRP